jgi:hypothetical protein
VFGVATVDDVEKNEQHIAHYEPTCNNIIRYQTKVLDTMHSLLATADEREIY